MTRRQMTLIGLTLALILLALASLCAGKVWVPFPLWFGSPTDPLWGILFQLRLPRTLLAMAVGATLGLTGAALQGYTRNPLADPGVLGVSAMAALGAVTALSLGLAGAAFLPTAAMAGALIGVVMLLMLAGTGTSMVTFVLAGVILNTLAGAGVALVMSLAPNPWAAGEIMDWLMGSLVDRSLADLAFALPFMMAGCGLVALTGRALDALTLGETGARSLGINLSRTRLWLALGVALSTGAAVAVTGVIGFVGLVVPHLLRPWVGARPSGLLMPAALGGAVLVLAGDVLVRLIPAEAEIKLGVAMALLGAPFFLTLLISLRRRLA